MLCSAGQYVSRKMDGEACPADGCGTRSFKPGSWSDRPRSGTASSGFIFTTWTCKIWRKSRTKASFSHLPLFRFWRKPGTKALFSHLPLWDFEGSLARKLYSHIFHFQLLRDVSHESFVFTSSTFRCWGMSRTKASVSHLPLSFLEGTRTKASFSHLHLSLLEGCLARNAFLKVSGCTKCCVLLGNTCLGRWMGKLVRRTGAEHARLNRDHGRIGRTVELPTQASFCQRSCA